MMKGYRIRHRIRSLCPIKDFANGMREAEERGFTIGFFSETWALMRDSVTSVAAMALATRKMHLGFTQIIRLRNPSLWRKRPLVSMSFRRAGSFCARAASEIHAKRHGLAHVTPAAALKERVEVFRHVLTGEKVDYQGELLKIEGAQLGWKPVRKNIPLWFAATSTTGLRLAGRLGDGVLLNTVSSPEYASNAIGIVRAAVEESGRDWSQFQVAILINTSVEDDDEWTFGLSNGSNQSARVTAARKLSITVVCVTPPKKRNAFSRQRMKFSVVCCQTASL